MPASPKLLIFTFIAFTYGALISSTIFGVILQASGFQLNTAFLVIALFANWFVLLWIFAPLWVKAPKLKDVPPGTSQSIAAEAYSYRYSDGRSGSSGSSRDTEHGAGLGGGYGGGCGCGCSCHH